MQRVIEVALIVVILLGVTFLWRSTVTRSQLTTEHERLAEKVGRLPIRDPSKVHIQAIKTGDPQHFVWRAYFPPNYSYSYTCSSGGGSGSNSEAWEGILRVRVREVNGQPQLYYSLLHGGGLRSFGSAHLTELFKEQPEQWKKLKVEQLAERELVIFAPSEVRTLLQLSLSDELLEKAKQRMSDWEYRQVSLQFETIRIGPQGFPEREAAGSK